MKVLALVSGGKDSVYNMMRCVAHGHEIVALGHMCPPDSVDELMSMPDIDGCLVGGASLDGEKFGRILNFN